MFEKGLELLLAYLSYVLCLLYRKREQIIKVPLETGREDRIRVTSIMKLIKAVVNRKYPRIPVFIYFR